MEEVRYDDTVIEHEFTPGEEWQQIVALLEKPDVKYVRVRRKANGEIEKQPVFR